MTVVDADGDRLPEFYRIYRETADRAGFLIRAESAYRDVWDAFSPSGNARLLFAQAADGEPQATLLLVRCGPRVVEPYGGMTAAGADSRANYLLKWEAIRSSREAGATSYDLWGLATGGIAHFKTGFGGREVQYIGAWDLVLSRVGRGAYDVAQRGRVWMARRRGGISRHRERRGLRGRRLNVRDATTEELADWDARAVDAPGGHVYQSRAWAEHRAASGWTPRFLVAGDGGRALALTRDWPLVPGGSAYLPRGPVAMGADPAALAARLIAIADALAGEGIDVVAADPEVPASETPFRAAIEAAGFTAIEEIQPSRHRISLPLGPGVDETAAFDGISKSTRQRIRAAESRRCRRRPPRCQDRARRGGGGVRPPDRAARGRPRPVLRPAARDRRAAPLLVRAAGRVRRLVARRARGGSPRLSRGARRRGRVAIRWPGSILYRHGGRLSTVHSGDHDATRTTHPGALHLLRWRAIQLAIREGCAEMDLGGVDVAGARGEPNEGDPLYGLYQHKTSFGGQWLELTGAHERVFDSRGYQAGRLAGRLARMTRR